MNLGKDRKKGEKYQLKNKIMFIQKYQIAFYFNFVFLISRYIFGSASMIGATSSLSINERGQHHFIQFIFCLTFDF